MMTWMMLWMVWEDKTPGDGEIDMMTPFEENRILVAAYNPFPLSLWMVPWISPLSDEMRLE
jgi:hypothetical protein